MTLEKYLEDNTKKYLIFDLDQTLFERHFDEDFAKNAGIDFFEVEMSFPRKRESNE